MAPDLRIAVVGQGLIGRQRAAALDAIEGATLAATIDPHTADGASHAPVPHYASLDDVPLAAYDAAVVAVPHDAAVELAHAVLRSGKPILVEKPLGTTAAEARKLEQLAARVGRPSFVGYNYRYLPSVRELMGVVAAGTLGPLRSVDMLMGHGGHPHSAEGWKLDPVRAGGGVILDPGVHLLDLLLRIAPGVSCRGVEASRGFWRTNIEEDVSISFRSEQLLASLRISHIRWVNTFRLEVFGEDGYAIAEGRGGNYGPLTLRTGRRWGWLEQEGMSQRETEQTWDFGSTDPSLRDELAAVVASWRGDGVPANGLHPATMAEARAVTELCDELYARIA